MYEIMRINVCYAFIWYHLIFRKEKEWGKGNMRTIVNRNVGDVYTFSQRRAAIIGNDIQVTILPIHDLKHRNMKRVVE